MSILTHIVAAEEEEIEAVGESLHPLEEWSGIEMRDVDIAKIATLHCLLTGDLFDDAAMLYEPAYISASEGALVLRLSDRMTERLAQLDEDALEAVAEELAGTEEYEDAGWDGEMIADMLNSLADIARLAEAQGQLMLAWMHPLRT